MAAVSIGQAWEPIWEEGVWAPIWEQGQATLTNPLAFPGSSHVGGRVTTDTVFGTIYGVLTASATPPTAQQIKDGEDDLGAPAVSSDSVPVEAAGDYNLDFAATPETAGYYLHFVQETIGFSDVVSTSTFATGAAGAGGGSGVRFIYDFSVRF